ncbi:hypothetical protein R1sor_006096 [Riccia sorocarpa]|uniref:Uncharacterized protein n=1 Tax=Riccia sorocarpa TaxID=122646 RepID=A0ABD3HLE8_9MARC
MFSLVIFKRRRWLRSRKLNFQVLELASPPTLLPVTFNLTDLQNVSSRWYPLASLFPEKPLYTLLLQQAGP